MSKSNTLPVTAALLVIAVITVTAYLPGMSAGFYFDDAPNFSEAGAMHWQELSLEALQRTLDEAWMPSRPVANISFAATHLASGLDPAPYHWTNLVIHLAVGLALFWVLRLFQRFHTADRGGQWVAALVVLVFLVHPLNTQAVTYVVQRMTSLSTLFLLLGFGCYLSARYSAVTAQRLAWLSLIFLFFFLSVGSKELGVLLLPLIILYEFCFNRARWLGWYREEATPVTKYSIAIGAALILILLAAAGWYVLEDRIYWSETMPRRDFSGLERLLTQGRVQFFYLSLLLWPAPSRLNLDHDFFVSQSLLDPITTLMAAMGWLLILLFALRNATSRPNLAFPILAYLLLHSIESAPINLELVFEHRMYMPMTMLALLLVLNTDSLPKTYLRPSYAALLTIGLLLSFATYQRNEVWSDPIDFLRDTAQKSPDKWRPQYNLGTELGRYGMLAEASLHLERAIRIKPNDSESHNQLANVYMRGNQQKAAERHYRLAIEHNESNAEALYNLSMLLGSQRRYAEQKAMLEKFIQHAPPYLDEQKRQAQEYLER
jgi:tetratricopeptide (TPR) repeat protein